jgi:hypothetical protein
LVSVSIRLFPPFLCIYSLRLFTPSLIRFSLTLLYPLSIYSISGFLPSLLLISPVPYKPVHTPKTQQQTPPSIYPLILACLHSPLSLSLISLFSIYNRTRLPRVFIPLHSVIIPSHIAYPLKSFKIGLVILPSLSSGVFWVLSLSFSRVPHLVTAFVLIVLTADLVYRLFCHPQGGRLTVFEISGAAKVHRCAISIKAELLFNEGSFDTSNHLVLRVLPVEELQIVRQRTVSLAPEPVQKNRRASSHHPRRSRGPGDRPEDPYVVD